MDATSRRMINDGDDDQDSFDTEIEELQIESLFRRPLEFIDPNADLDAVLESKTVGEAMQLLSPAISGLFSKTRGKYHKIRLLDSDLKCEIMRGQKRNNAKRTRKRRKVFSRFLALSEQALENALKQRLTRDHNVSDPPNPSYSTTSISTKNSESTDITLGPAPLPNRSNCAEFKAGSLNGILGASPKKVLLGTTESDSNLSASAATESSLLSLSQQQQSSVAGSSLSRILEDRAPQSTTTTTIKQGFPIVPKGGHTHPSSEPSSVPPCTPSPPAPTGAAWGGDRSFLTTGAITSLLIDGRLQALRRFMQMRYSKSPHTESWSEVCGPYVMVVIPVPKFRTYSSSGIVRGDFLELRGTATLVEDASLQSAFIASVLMFRGGESAASQVQIRLRPERTSISGDGLFLRTQVDLEIFAPKIGGPVDEYGLNANTGPTNWVMLSTEIHVNASFSINGNIELMTELSDDREFFSLRAPKAPSPRLVGGPLAQSVPQCRVQKVRRLRPTKTGSEISSPPTITTFGPTFGDPAYGPANVEYGPNPAMTEAQSLSQRSPLLLSNWPLSSFSGPDTVIDGPANWSNMPRGFSFDPRFLYADPLSSQGQGPTISRSCPAIGESVGLPEKPPGAAKDGSAGTAAGAGAGMSCGYGVLRPLPQLVIYPDFTLLGGVLAPPHGMDGRLLPTDRIRNGYSSSGGGGASGSNVNGSGGVGAGAGADHGAGAGAGAGSLGHGYGYGSTHNFF